MPSASTCEPIGVGSGSSRCVSETFSHSADRSRSSRGSSERTICPPSTSFL
ncbi:hypothetical protein ACFPRL_27165 [Pseudoclavibacter helvolus]